MGPLASIAVWVLASTFVGLAVGVFLARSRGTGRPSGNESELVARERRATVKVLVELLRSVDQAAGHVESHTTEIRQTANHVGAMEVSGEMETVKEVLMGHMVGLLQSNHRLQDDLLCTRYQMEEQAQVIDQARREARTDALTGVANRKALDEKLHVLMAGWHRQQQPFVLMMLDLDYLKRINDSHGHQAGDQVLEKIGLWLKEWVREGDFVGRYGGDEFAVLLPRTELTAGVELAERICSRAAERASRITFRGEQVSVSLSIGVTASVEGDGLESLVRRADEALYRAKNRGRNQVQCHSGSPKPPPVTATDGSVPGPEPVLGSAPPGAPHVGPAFPFFSSPSPASLDTGSACG